MNYISWRTVTDLMQCSRKCHWSSLYTVFKWHYLSVSLKSVAHKYHSLTVLKSSTQKNESFMKKKWENYNWHNIRPYHTHGKNTISILVKESKSNTMHLYVPLNMSSLSNIISNKKIFAEIPYEIHSSKTVLKRLPFKIINIKHILTNYIGYFFASRFTDAHIHIFENAWNTSSVHIYFKY